MFVLKWKSLKPNIIQLINVLFFFVGIPIILFAINLVDVTLNNEYGNLRVIFVIAGISIYFYIIAGYLVPGIYSLFDLITDNFITCKMVYINSYIDKSKFLAFNKATTKVGRVEMLNEHCFMKVLLADHKGKSAFSTTFYHLMEKDKRYTIQYGKFSKVIVSILSEKGDELLQFDVK